MTGERYTGKKRGLRLLVKEGRGNNNGVCLASVVEEEMM